jgi:hypothetical protein
MGLVTPGILNNRLTARAALPHPLFSLDTELLRLDFLGKNLDLVSASTEDESYSEEKRKFLMITCCSFLTKRSSVGYCFASVAMTNL